MKNRIYCELNVLIASKLSQNHYYLRNGENLKKNKSNLGMNLGYDLFAIGCIVQQSCPHSNTTYGPNIVSMLCCDVTQIFLKVEEVAKLHISCTLVEVTYWGLFHKSNDSKGSELIGRFQFQKSFDSEINSILDSYKKFVRFLWL